MLIRNSNFNQTHTNITIYEVFSFLKSVCYVKLSERNEFLQIKRYRVIEDIDILNDSL